MKYKAIFNGRTFKIKKRNTQKQSKENKWISFLIRKSIKYPVKDFYDEHFKFWAFFHKLRVSIYSYFNEEAL